MDNSINVIQLIHWTQIHHQFPPICYFLLTLRKHLIGLIGTSSWLYWKVWSLALTCKAVSLCFMRPPPLPRLRSTVSYVLHSPFGMAQGRGDPFRHSCLPLLWNLCSKTSKLTQTSRELRWVPQNITFPHMQMIFCSILLTPFPCCLT